MGEYIGLVWVEGTLGGRCGRVLNELVCAVSATGSLTLQKGEAKQSQKQSQKKEAGRVRQVYGCVHEYVGSQEVC